MGVYKMQQIESVPLKWTGDIIIQRPQIFTEEEYQKYFNPEMISYDRLTKYMKEPVYSMFHKIPVWVLQDTLRDKIKSDILETGKVEDNQSTLKWMLEFTATSENGDYWGFDELSKGNQERILKWMDEPKNGICQGTTIAVTPMNYIVQVSKPTPVGEDTLTGRVRLNYGPAPEECDYQYDIKSGEATLLNRTESEFKEGFFFDEPLPQDISKYCSDIEDAVEQECEEYLEKANPSLDSVIHEAQKKQRNTKIENIHLDNLFEGR